MYRMLTGQHPFQGSTPVVLCHAIATLPHTPLRQHVPEVSAGLEAVIDRLLQKNPAHRFQTAAQVIEALERLSQQASTRPARWRTKGAISLGLLAVIAVHQATQLADWGRDSTTQSNVAITRDSPQHPGTSPTTHHQPSDPTELNTASAVPTPSIPEVLDATGVVWRSLNREHAGLVSVDADGVIRLEKPAENADNWAMIEAELAALPENGGYLLLDVVELSGRGDVSWAAKLAPSEGSRRDIELNYGQSAGQFAFRLPQQMGTRSGAVRARIFIVGSDGASVRFRDVRIANAVPEGYRVLSVLPGN
jgi:hypothetical protein